jgi:hypothetical protein
MAVADPAHGGRIDDPRHCLAYALEQTTVACVKQEWLVVFEQELTELESRVGVVCAEPIHIGRDLDNARHAL